jgi:hypothetical protein
MQEKSLEKILQMSHKMMAMSRLSKGSSLQVMQKDKEWQIKYDKIQFESTSKICSLEKQVRSLDDERSITKKNYEAQIRMLSDHIVDLNE